MFATDGHSTFDFTDVARFTGRSPRVLGVDARATGTVGICITSVTRLDELALFTRLNAIADALSPTVVWLLTDCGARLAGDIAKWCERRDVLWHYCGRRDTFALARK